MAGQKRISADKVERSASGESGAPSSAKKRTCFVIMPFGTKTAAAPDGTGATAGTGTDADALWRLVIPKGGRSAQYEIDFDRLYETVIKPAVEGVEGYSIDCKRCDDPEIAYTGWIHEKMIQHIADDDIAIVELTTLNPNVFYELGVRHALNKAVTVLIQQEGLGERIPFNLGGMSVVKYRHNEPERAREEIRQTISASLARHDHVDSLVFSTLDDLEVQVRKPRPARETVFHHYQLQDMERCIGVVTGNIANVKGIDVWVSSENTEMMMARYHERAVSATIRFLGAEKNEANAVTNDLIFKELGEATKDVTCVPAGTVVVTGSGQLEETHGVKWVFHAASVTGQVGRGYTPIPDPTACVVNALERADSSSFRDRHAARYEDGPPVSSLLFPLFGAGQAGRDPEDVASSIVATVVAHFKRNPDSSIRRVYFLAYTEEGAEMCNRVLASQRGGALISQKACPGGG